MPREDGEVDVEGLDVECEVRRGLARVEHHERTHRAGTTHQLGHGIDEPQHVGDVREGQHPGAGAEHLVGGVEPERAVVVDRDEPQGRARAGGQLLPGEQVGVVLHLGDDDLVAGTEPEGLRRVAAAAEARVRERVGDEVERLGGVGGPDDLVVGRADEAGDRGPGVLEQLGGLGGQRVCAAVHRRVGAPRSTRARRPARRAASATSPPSRDTRGGDRSSWSTGWGSPRAVGGRRRRRGRCRRRAAPRSRWMR